MYKKQRACTMR